ncbi:ANTR protein, partial [Bucco capensis]|nr:ANTR protein [Bucco capensis]
MKVQVCLGLLLSVAVPSCLCRAAAAVPGAAGDARQLPASLVRRDWPQALSQEQKHLISQFLPHFFTELSVPGDKGMEALHDHYYPDWMDFGRRSTEDSGDA